MSPRTNVWLLRFVPVRAETRLGSALRRTLDSYNEAAADRRTLVRFTVWTLAEVLVVVVVVFFAGPGLFFTIMAHWMRFGVGAWRTVRLNPERAMEWFES